MYEREAAQHRLRRFPIRAGKWLFGTMMIDLRKREDNGTDIEDVRIQGQSEKADILKEGKEPFAVYVRSGTQQLRCGFTTGTCAALAAAGATQLLLTGKAPETVRVVTPKGIPVEVEPEECRIASTDNITAICSVRKDAGDDPDVTNSMLVTVSVSRTDIGISIDGGEGVGRVTKPGLDQPVGAAAINSVPRKMIAAAAQAICEEQGYAGGLEIVVSIPEGRQRALKTFNPQLGIEGGLSVLGTSGIVEPMSERALLDTIALEIRQKSFLGGSRLILTPGNYGTEYLRKESGIYRIIPQVKCSNFLGDALDMAAAEGFREVLLVGHVGKLVKLAAGIMNTHSHMADGRREIFCAHAAVCGAAREVCEDLMNQVTTDGCLEVLDRTGLREEVMRHVLAAIQGHLDRCAAGAMKTGALLFSNVYGTLGMTDGARTLLEEWEKRT